MVRAVVGLLLVAACAGCAAPHPGGSAVERFVLRNVEIHEDTVWSGRVLIDGWVKVFKGANLTILPGTDIAFTPRDDDRDALGDGTLIVEGSLVAVGHRDAPIVFHSAAPDPQPGDWLELRVDFSRNVHLQYCEIRDSAHALHAHFTRAVLEDSHIHNNQDGSRLGQGHFILQRNLIEKNTGKGINFRNAQVTIVDNIIRFNGAGLFIFETDRSMTIAGNNFYGNGDNLRLGDFFQRDVVIGENWWGSADPVVVAAAIHDRRADETLGRVTVGIAPAWLEQAGPDDPAHLAVSAGPVSEGFVDAAPVAVGEHLLTASWDGQLRLDDGAGRRLWTAAAGEVVDSAPVWDGQRIYAQSWGREVFALAADNGQRLWSFTYPPSPHDDHRQGGVARVADLLLVPAWNGSLYALDAAHGTLRWRYPTPGPLRATPTVEGERIYLPAGDGVLRALDLTGNLLWERRSAAALLAPLALAESGPVSLDRDGNLTAFDRDGRILWQRALGEPCFYAGPCAVGETLFVATAAGNLWKLSGKDGSLVWRKGGLGPIYATPLWFEGRVLIGDNDGGLSLIDGNSGRILDRRQFEAAIQGGPTRLGDRRLTVGCRDHRVYLIEVRAPAKSGGVL